MKKEQALGQLRAFLTALGTILATWGVNDGNQWAPVVGVIIAGYSLTWGLLHHKDPATPGRMSWSLFRKFINIAGSAALTYGVLNPERFSTIGPLVAALGPLLAARFSWIDNTDDDTTPPPAVPVWLLIASLACLFPSCAEYPISGRATYTDAKTGAKVGIDYPADISSPRIALRLPIQDAAGNTTGYVDLRSGK